MNMVYVWDEARLVGGRGGVQSLTTWIYKGEVVDEIEGEAEGCWSSGL